MDKEEKTPEKSSKATVAQRVDAVIDLLLAGAMPRDIVRYGSENGWGIGKRQIEKYITAANGLIAESLEKDRAKLLADHLARRRRLFSKANEAGDYRTALACAQDEAKLCDLYPATKTELTGKGGNPLEFRNLSDDELDSTIADLESRLRDSAPGTSVEDSPPRPCEPDGSGQTTSGPVAGGIAPLSVTEDVAPLFSPER